jgi:hypothetical protein
MIFMFGYEVSRGLPKRTLLNNSLRNTLPNAVSTMGMFQNNAIMVQLATGLEG